MYLGPKLVIRGLFFGVIILVVFSSALTTGASPPPPLVDENINNQNVAGTEDLNQSEMMLSDDCRVSNKYPANILQWCEIITTFAEQYKLPPNLIAALIWQESGGKPQAYSKSGAVGLMQVMPSDGIAATFMCVNGPCFTNRPTIEELEDPVFNVKYGTRMLARLIDRHGDIREALKAYGPMNVGYTYSDKVLAIYNNHTY